MRVEKLPDTIAEGPRWSEALFFLCLMVGIALGITGGLVYLVRLVTG